MSGSISPRIAALCGTAFAILLFLSVAMIDVPHSASDQALIDWWSTSGNQTASVVCMYLKSASALALVIFLSHLRDRLNRDGGSGGNAMLALGVVSAAMFVAAAAAHGVAGNAVKVNDEPLPGAETLRYLTQLSYTFIDLALISVGGCVLMASWAIRQSKALPMWLAWVGLVAGVLLIVGTMVVGPLSIPIALVWALAASVAVFRGGATTEAPVLKRSSLPA